MGLFNRMSRAVSANWNALLDAAEDPKKAISQTILDMEEQLRLARREIVESVASEKQLKGRGEDLTKEAEKWERRAELAVKHGDDGLAREALLHKRRVLGERDRAEGLRAEQRRAALELKSDFERMERTLQGVKAKQGTLAAQLGMARAGGGPEGLGAKPGSDAFGEFRRMEEQIEGVEAAIAAEREVSEALAPARGPTGMSRDEVEARFRALEVGDAPRAAPSEPDDVAEELATLKARVRVDPG
jgi:phage shock protein A